MRDTSRNAQHMVRYAESVARGILSQFNVGKNQTAGQTNPVTQNADFDGVNSAENILWLNIQPAAENVKLVTEQVSNDTK